MKILKIIGIVVAALAGTYFLVISLMPSKVYVERSIIVNTSPQEAFNYLEDLRNFPDWAYWAELDPTTKYDYEGSLRGKGSKMYWSSDRHGEKYVSWYILNTSPHTQIQFKVEIIDFAKPAIMEINFSKEGDSVRIHWNFQTDFHGHWKFYVPMMETELGPEFENGLSNIKRILEK